MSGDMIVTRISIGMDGITPAKIKFWKGGELIKQGQFNDFEIRQRHGVAPIGGIDGGFGFEPAGEDQIEIKGTYHVIGH